MKIIAVIINNDQTNLLGDCIQSIIAGTPDKHEVGVVLVDNFSDGSSKKLVMEKFPRVELIENNSFKNECECINQGIRLAIEQKADFIWLTVPSITVFPDMFLYLLQAAEKYHDSLLFTPKIYSQDQGNSPKLISAGGSIDWSNIIGKFRGAGEQDSGLFERDLEIDYIPQSAMFIRVKAISEVGVFDPKYFLYYADMDYCSRVRFKSYKLMYVFMARAFSLDTPSNIPKSAVTYYRSRNRFYFGLKSAPVSSKLILIRDAWNLYFHGEPWQRRAVLDVFSGNLGSGSYQWD